MNSVKKFFNWLPWRLIFISLILRAASETGGTEDAPASQPEGRLARKPDLRRPRGLRLVQPELVRRLRNHGLALLDNRQRGQDQEHEEHPGAEPHLERQREVADLRAGRWPLLQTADLPRFGSEL